MVSRTQFAFDPADLGTCRQHSRRDRRLGNHPAGSRQVRARYPAAAGDQGRGTRLCGDPAQCLRLEPAVREAEERHQHRALSAAAWQGGGGGRCDPPARAWPNPAGDRQGRPRCLLHGGYRRGHGGDPARHRRPAYAGGFRRPWHRDHGADRHRVQGPRCLAVPAERSGHHHAGDAEHPVAVRSDEVSRDECRALSSRSRGGAGRLHDARAIHRRSRPCRCRCGQDSGRGNSPTSTAPGSGWTGCWTCRMWRHR